MKYEMVLLEVFPTFHHQIHVRLSSRLVVLVSQHLRRLWRRLHLVHPSRETCSWVDGRHDVSVALRTEFDREWHFVKVLLSRLLVWCVHRRPLLLFLPLLALHLRRPLEWLAQMEPHLAFHRRRVLLFAV